MMIPFLTMFTALTLAVVGYYMLGARGVILRVLLPAFVFFSFAFSFQASPGLPALSIYTTMSLVVAAAIWTIDRPVVAWQIPDFFVVLFVLASGASSFITAGPQPMFLELMSNLVGLAIPYFLIRIAVPKDFMPRFLISFVFLLVVLAALAPLEAFLRIRPTLPLQLIWPTYASSVDFFRGGFNRVAGTFGHPIHAGMMYSLALIWSGFFFLDGRFGVRSRWITAGLILGAALFLTGSRSSYVFSFPILAMVYFHFSRRPKSYAIVGLVLVAVTLFVAMPIYDAYAGASDLSSADETQTSAAYRKQLGESYMNLVMARPMTGWGPSLPVINGQNSIDNAYLLYSLVYGIPVTVLFWLISATAVVAGLQAYFTRLRKRLDGGLVWLMICCLAFVAICAYIVWLTAQALAMYFVLTALLANLTAPEPPRRLMAGARWL